MCTAATALESILASLRCFAGGGLPGTPPDPDMLSEILRISSRNNLRPLMHKVLREPKLEKSYQKSMASTVLSAHEVGRVFDGFDRAGVRAILLRGLYLGCRVYGNPALRPFTDIDVLVEKGSTAKACEALESLGYHHSVFALPQQFFLDAHLHLHYFHPELRVPCEVHWAVEHPFTLYDIRMGEVFETAISTDLEGIRCYDIKPELRLVLLLVHLQKHLFYLRHRYDAPDLVEQIAKDGQLLRVLDPYLFLKRNGEAFDWSLFLAKAARWNVDGVMYSTLRTVDRVFGPSTPAEVLGGLPPPTPSRREVFFTSHVLPRLSSSRLVARISSRLIFRRERLADLWTWLFPDRKTIVRRFGVSSRAAVLWCYCRNLARCTSTILTLSVRYIRWRAGQSRRRRASP